MRDLFLSYTAANAHHRCCDVAQWTCAISNLGLLIIKKKTRSQCHLLCTATVNVWVGILVLCEGTVANLIWGGFPVLLLEVDAALALNFSATDFRAADAELSLGLLASAESGSPELASLASAGARKRRLLAPLPGEGELKRSLADVGDCSNSSEMTKTKYLLQNSENQYKSSVLRFGRLLLGCSMRVWSRECSVWGSQVPKSLVKSAHFATI